jgi:CubicO group peptidase (beta-lactamase class C family)
MAALVACSDAGPSVDDTPVPQDGATYWPAAEWRSAQPQQVNLDRAALSGLVTRFRSGSFPYVNSLVVVRQGYLVVDEYFHGSSRNDVHTMQSVTKSVTSLVVGIAADQGKLALSDSILRFFPQYTTLQNWDDRKRGVTVRDLLTMRSGIDFYESPYPGSPLQILNDSRDDWVKIVLDRPMNDVAGGHWQYNSGGPIVLAGAVRSATGTAFDTFAEANLFTPLGITSQRWYLSPFDGLPHAGGGLNLRAVDLARIGYLVLRGGKWGDRQVISSAWLADAFTPRSVRPRTFGTHDTDYGYLWWLLPLEGNDVIWTGAGALGQWLFVIPRHDMVVVVTGSNDASFVAGIDALYSTILPAVR